MTHQTSETIDRDRRRASPARPKDGFAPSSPVISVAFDESALDVASLLELFDGSSEAVARLLEVAARSIEQDLERIEAATLAGDAAAAAQAAHRLKGTSGSISAKRVSGIGSTIERAVLAESPAAAASLVLELHAAVDSLLASVASYTSGAARTAVAAET